MKLITISEEYSLSIRRTTGLTLHHRISDESSLAFDAMHISETTFGFTTTGTIEVFDVASCNQVAVLLQD